MPNSSKLLAQLASLPPEEAVKYMQARGLLKQSFAWQDVWQQEHATQFTVSRLARTDLLQAVYDGVTASVKGDMGRRDFLRGLQDIFINEGWWGEKQVTDPKTGELLTTKFNPARLKLIYDTNTRMAYSAGLWQRIERNQATSPYIRYITKRDERVRASHRAWDNLTLPVGHPFWDTHFPPNGWRCRCRAMSLSQADYDKGVAPDGRKLNKQAPEVDLVEWQNKRTGAVEMVPRGVDPAFAYNPGKAAARQANLDNLKADKLASLAAPLRKAAEKDFADNGGMQKKIIDYATRARDDDGETRHLILGGIIDALRIQADTGKTLDGYTHILDAAKLKHIFDSHGNPAREAKQNQRAVTENDITRLSDVVDGYDSVELSVKTANGGLAVLEFVKRFSDGEFHYKAEIRSGKKHLAPATLFIKV